MAKENMMLHADRVYPALDVPNIRDAELFLRMLRWQPPRVKVGSFLYTSVGLRAVEFLRCEEVDVFLDLKWADPEHMVAMAVEHMPRGVVEFTVHFCAGRKSIVAAVSAATVYAEKHQCPAPNVLVVTALTSLEDQDLIDQAIIRPGMGPNALECEMVRRSLIAQQCGAQGVIASVREVAAIRRACGPDFRIVVPGIRFEDSAVETENQQRIGTPLQAFQAGADAIVVGRPLLEASDPFSTYCSAVSAYEQKGQET